MRRHKALIPLSSDHHLALVLVQRIRRGRSKAPKSTWPEDRILQRDRTLEFFDSELRPHLQAEEDFLFPLADRRLGTASTMTTVLRQQHAALREISTMFRQASGAELERLLIEFADLLEEHIRKEERIFFERLQEAVPAEELIDCGRRMEEFLKAHRPAESCIL